MISGQIVFDSIIWSLQTAGGISRYWSEIVSKVYQFDEMAITNIEYVNNNAIRADYKNKIPTGENRSLLSTKMTRLFSCRLPKSIVNSKEHIIYHSSFYRKPSGKKCREIVTVHDMIPELYGKGASSFFQKKIKRKAIDRADIIICVSNNTKNDLLNMVPSVEDRTHVIYNGVSDIYRPATKIEPSKSEYALFVGVRRGYKNFDLAVAAISRLDNLNLIAIGGGNLHASEKKFVQERLGDRFQHYGSVSEKRINQLYNEAFCLVYPSSYEGFGLPVLEAMRAGCPVVCLNESSVGEIAGKQYPTLNTMDSESIKAAILDIKNEKRRATIIKIGIERSKDFTWERCAKETMELYKALM